MGANQQESYNVDITLCIDCTGSMGPVIEDVKANALRFHGAVEERMATKGKSIDNFRMRVIGFRDFFCDDEPILAMPDFVDLRTDAAKFESFVRRLEAKGGGDEPENGLEALALAMKSNWNRAEQAKARHLIVVWTDASAHALEKAVAEPPSKYPSGLPKSLDELTAAWHAMHLNSRRLVIYAPDAHPWSVIGASWPQSMLFFSKAGQGLEEIEFGQILDTIASSIG